MRAVLRLVFDRADRSIVDPTEFGSVLLAACEGAEWAWHKLYRSYSSRVLGYLRTRGAVEPEDLLGEVWLHIARRLNDFSGDEAGFRSWLFLVAHNRLIDERRKRARRPSAPNAPADLAVEDGSPAGDGDAEAMASAELDDLLELLDGMPEVQKSVVLLRIIADLSVAQTSEVLAMTEAAVKSATYRAVDTLRGRLAAATKKSPPSVTELK